MGYPAVFALSVGLAMDATAVAASRGLAAREVRASDAALIALLFGGFQAGMPYLGWLGGTHVSLVMRWQHAVAFVVLVALGLEALHESRGADTDEPAGLEPFAIGPVLALAVATSIDALAAGVTLPTLGAPLGPSLALIGLTTAVLSLAGVVLGRRLGAWAGRRLDAIGGVILVGLGVKILAAHLMSAPPE